MRHRNDFIRLNLTIDATNISLDAMNMKWPPPPFIHLLESGGFMGMTEEEANRLHPSENQFVMVRTSYSAITDEQIAEMPNVARGAEYHYMEKPK